MNKKNNISPRKYNTALSYLHSTGLKFSKTLEVSLDYLTGNTDLELDLKTLQRIVDISKIPEQDRGFIFKALDALLRDYKTQKAYS